MWKRFSIPDEATWTSIHVAWQTWLARDFDRWKRWREHLAEYRRQIEAGQR